MILLIPGTYIQNILCIQLTCDIMRIIFILHFPLKIQKLYLEMEEATKFRLNTAKPRKIIHN